MNCSGRDRCALSYSSGNPLEKPDADEDLGYPGLGEGANIGAELSFLQRREFARLDNTSLRKVRLANFDDHVAGETYALGVGRKGAGDDSGEAAVVEQVGG